MIEIMFLDTYSLHHGVEFNALKIDLVYGFLLKIM